MISEYHARPETDDVQSWPAILYRVDSEAGRAGRYKKPAHFALGNKV